MIIDLTIKTSYLPKWGEYEGIRELIQNAKDAETELNAEFLVSHARNTLTITSKGVKLPREVLLLGHTTKLKNSALIGKFGEGMKLGILALVRDHHTVNIQNGGESWTPKLRFSTKFNSTILSFDIRKKSDISEDLVIKINGITEKAWEQHTKRFLFLQKDQYNLEHRGTILDKLEHRGQIFAKGIYVNTQDNLYKGYNLNNLDVDRDRSMVSDFDLKWELKQTWADALDRDPALVTDFINLLEKNATDIDLFSSSVHLLNYNVKKEIHNHFVGKYGKQTWPCYNADEVQKVSFLGKYGKVFGKAYVAILTDITGSIDALERSLARETIGLFTEETLTAEEKQVLERSRFLLSKSETAREIKVSMRIVKFRNEETLGLYYEGERRYDIARKQLKSVKDCLKVMVHELSHALNNAGDGSKDHIDTMQTIWSEIIGTMES